MKQSQTIYKINHGQLKNNHTIDIKIIVSDT